MRKRWLILVVFLVAAFVAAQEVDELVMIQPVTENITENVTATPTLFIQDDDEDNIVVSDDDDPEDDEDAEDDDGVATNLQTTLLFPTGTVSQSQNAVFNLSARIECVSACPDDDDEDDDDDNIETDVFSIQDDDDDCDDDDDNQIQDGTCGIVNASLLVNETTPLPSDLVSGNGIFDTPFYTIEANPLTCGLMNTGDVCIVNWIINATGDVGESWLLAVNASDTTSDISDSVEVTVIGDEIAITISTALASVVWNLTTPGTDDNPAINNSNKAYFVLCEVTGGDCNVSIRGNDDLRNGPNIIGLENISWNTEDNPGTSTPLTFSFKSINESVSDNKNITLYWWLDVPSLTAAGLYGSNFTVRGTIS